jgi:hypothetical protein
MTDGVRAAACRRAPRRGVTPARMTAGRIVIAREAAGDQIDRYWLC